jgi:hypothetical protein
VARCRTNRTNPRAIFENQFQPIRADDLADLVSTELRRIRLQLLSGLPLHLGRQAEVFALRTTGTKVVT